MAGILSAPGASPRGERLLLAGLAAFWLILSLPLLLGQKTLLQRDVFTTHLAMKAYGAAALAHGHVPAFNPTWALGQPFAGNPNALPYYPGNLLYLVLPFWSAFNAHYVLHWLLAFVGFRALAREVGQSALGATMAALTYAGSGYVLSCLTFYNLIAVSAWLPFVLWGLARAGRRGTLWGGIACGMMLLSGEPVTAALAVALMAVVAVERHGWRKGLLVALAVGGLGLAIALPQVVAAARTFGFTYRGAHGLLAEQAENHALHPLRLLELFLPLPWGWPAELGRFAFWSNVTPITPYIYSLHFGILALAAGLFGVRRHRRWALVAVGALALAYVGGFSGSALLAMTGGLFRYPQKLLLWTTVGAALLAGWGLDVLVSPAATGAGQPPGQRPRGSRGLAIGAGLMAVAALAMILFRAQVRRLFLEQLDARRDFVAATQQTQWFLGLCVAALLLAGAAWAVRRQNGAAFVLLAALSLAQFAPMIATDDVEALAPPAPWISLLGANRSIVQVANTFPKWEPEVPVQGVESVVEGWRDARLDLEPATAALYGVTYPLAPDLDGIYSPLHALLLQNLAALDWSARILWLRVLGAGWVVARADPASPVPLDKVAESPRLRGATGLYRVPDPAPIAFWPPEVVAAESPLVALAMTTRLRDPLAAAAASRAVDHHAGGRVELLDAEDDRLRFAVDSAGGLLVVQRAYFPLIEARLEDGSRLATQPVDLVLLGVEVPAGRHEVRIGSSQRPEALAGGLSLLVLLLCGVVGWRRP